MLRICAPVLLSLLPSFALADATLMGKDFTFQVVTLDKGETLFETPTVDKTVTDDVEFSLDRTRGEYELDVVPVTIDVQGSRITLAYDSADPGFLLDAEFNGYLLGFKADCPLFANATVDKSRTNLPFTEDNISAAGNVLALNVQGIAYNRKSRIAIDLVLNECGASGSTSGGKKSKS